MWRHLSSALRAPPFWRGPAPREDETSFGPHIGAQVTSRLPGSRGWRVAARPRARTRPHSLGATDPATTRHPRPGGAPTPPPPPERSAHPATAPYTRWSATCGPSGSARTRGNQRASTPRSSAATARPKTAPPTTPARRGITKAQKRDTARCAGTAAASSGPVRRSRAPSTTEPAARAASRGSAPVRSACVVDGAPLTTAARRPALRRPAARSCTRAAACRRASAGPWRRGGCARR